MHGMKSISNGWRKDYLNSGVEESRSMSLRSVFEFWSMIQVTHIKLDYGEQYFRTVLPVMFAV